MTYYVLFFTHSGAIKFDMKCRKMNIQCELMPVPRALSSNCSVSAKILFDDPVSLIDDEVEKIFLMQDDKNVLVYEAE